MLDVAHRVRDILWIDIVTESFDQVLHETSIFSLKCVYSWRPSTLIIDINREEKEILTSNHGKTNQKLLKTIRIESD
jgi:hypothetical protein